MRSFQAVALLVLCLSAASQVSAWGDTGHELTGYIAQNLLDSDTLSQVQSILGGSTLEDVATWADKIRSDPSWAWTKTLHFVNTPDWACNYDGNRDCSDEQCCVGAIYNFTSELDPSSSKSKKRAEALKFLVHFIGDLHQPLHVSFASDRGGNDIHGHYDNKKTNLHSVWDNALIKDRLKSFSNDQDNYGDWIVSQVQGAWASQAQKWANNINSDNVVDSWATETAGIACSNAYTDEDGNQIQDGFDLGKAYFNFNKNVLDQQLAKAGVRMAAYFANIFSNKRIALETMEELPSNQALPLL